MSNRSFNLFGNNQKLKYWLLVLFFVKLAFFVFFIVAKWRRSSKKKVNTLLFPGKSHCVVNKDEEVFVFGNLKTEDLGEFRQFQMNPGVSVQEKAKIEVSVEFAKQNLEGKIHSISSNCFSVTKRSDSTRVLWRLESNNTGGVLNPQLSIVLSNIQELVGTITLAIQLGLGQVVYVVDFEMQDDGIKWTNGKKATIEWKADKNIFE